MKKIIILLFVVLFLASCGNEKVQKQTPPPPNVLEVATWVQFEKENYEQEDYMKLLADVENIVTHEWAEDARLNIASSIITKDLSVAQYSFIYHSQSKSDNNQCSKLFVYYNDEYNMSKSGNYQIHSASGKPVNNKRLFGLTPTKEVVCEKQQTSSGGLDVEKIEVSPLEVVEALKNDLGDELKPNSMGGEYYLLMMAPMDAGQYWWLGSHKIDGKTGEIAD